MVVDSENYRYTNPTFVGVDWFIRCDDDEGARLIVKSRAKTLKAALAKARRCVKGMVVVVVSRTDYYQTRTALPTGGIHAAWNFSIAIDGLMPDTSCYAARTVR